MKLKIVYSLFFMHLVLFIHNAKASDNQYFTPLLTEEYLTDYDKLLQSVCTPLKFTRSGMRCFLKHTFNRKEYAQDILPHTLHHLIQFLEYGKKSGQENTYIQSTLRLFNNKIKSCKYITSDALCQTLERFPDLIKEYLVEEPQTSWFLEAKNIVKKLLYSTFLSGFSLFKKDPEQFFNDLSTEMVDTLHNSSFVQESINQEQLRQTTIRLIETMVSKVIWSPLDQIDTWISVKTISSHLDNLMQHDILNQDELDDVLKSLVEQFVHFLELTGSDLSFDVIDNIKKDLESGNLLFHAIDEQEEFIESKVDRLKKAVMETEAKIYARHRGIITEVIPAKY